MARYRDLLKGVAEDLERLKRFVSDLDRRQIETEHKLRKLKKRRR